jgi:deoxycytidylate deaminase
MLHRFLEMAKRFAAHHQYERNMEYRLCAVLVKGGKSISVGYNKRTRSELMRRFAIRDHQTVHAEVDAVLQVRRKIDLTGSKICTRTRHQIIRRRFYNRKSARYLK